jgi:hypothetical protein
MDAIPPVIPETTVVHTTLVQLKTEA